MRSMAQVYQVVKQVIKLSIQSTWGWLTEKDLKRNVTDTLKQDLVARKVHHTPADKRVLTS